MKEPFQVAFFRDGVLKDCSGTIISDRWIVTAAHCFWHQLDPAGLQVAVGVTSNLNVPQDHLYQVSQMILFNPNFTTANLDDDIMLIELATPLTFSCEVQPIGIITNAHPELNDPGQQAYVSGWGKTAYPGSGSSVLKGIGVPIIANPASVIGIPTTDNMIATNYANGGPCFGDSGGPLTVAINGVPYLVGVVSFGEPCAGPTMYANVLNYASWICSYANCIPDGSGPSTSGPLNPNLFFLTRDMDPWDRMPSGKLYGANYENPVKANTEQVNPGIDQWSWSSEQYFSSPPLTITSAWR